MSHLATLVERATRDGDLLERAIFSSSDPEAIAHHLESFVRKTFGAEPDFTFYRHSVGIVVGALIADQRVIVKVHHWHATTERLIAIQRVQRGFAALGLPAPRPLAAATTLAAGVVTVEEMLPGDVADGHDSLIRSVLAHELHRFIIAGRQLRDTVGLEPPALTNLSADVLWPTPHAPRFDFEASNEGAAWIDDFARRARRRLASRRDDVVVGYLDWRVGNLGFTGSNLTAIYDWDSVGLASEAFVVGSAAATFSIDWSKPGGALPDLAEMREFVADYERSRGRPFDEEEVDVLDAANALLIAYGARCQHSDVVRYGSGDAPVTRSWLRLLGERGDGGLRR